MTRSRHLATPVAAPAAAVYAYAADPAHLPQWAAGLASSTVERDGGRWVAESPMGRVEIELTAPNDLGVLDHTVTLPGGERVLNPMRVIPDGDGCEVVFTVRQRPGMSDAAFEDDCRAVSADLQTLRSVVEAAPQ
jgi:Polyketide cyclase / dehydrase and lipid transport